MFQALSSVLLPVILVAGLGALLSSRFPVDQGTVSRLTLYLLSPALVLDVILRTPVKVGEALHLGGAYLLTLGLCLALGWACGWGQPNLTRRSYSASVGIWNSGNMGLPIALFAFGQSGFERATVLFLASFVGMYLVGPALYSLGRGGAHWLDSLRDVLRLPALWATGLGLALRLLHVPLPEGLTRGVSLLAQATLPMILLTLGLHLGAAGWPRLTPRVWLASAARLVGGPLIALGVGRALGLDGANLAVLILSAAMPTAVNALLIAREYDADVGTVADVITLSTVLSVVTIAAVVTLLPRLG
ncbi:AEC family transporter [Deinococcus koreensis]|uniref:AEC family transporter n=1 Tax=Deinococcus koreensis TaxID=2054903 RepID=A0A2K3UWE3_9DEIO|nr:AEC family transporter [Deinococcus koreensis]PNY80856.1 AEC family transporter [Deinococcus koreensis]